jgi:hypothetical protein
MRVLKIYMLFVALLTSSVVFAQDVVKGSLDVCGYNVHPIDLSEDVVGLGLSAGGGKWYKVSNPDSYESELTELNVVSNILLAIDLQPGEYYYVFVPDNNPCLDDKDRAIATINILESPESISHTIALCSDEELDFDLASLVSPLLKEKYPSMKFKDEGGKELASSTIAIAGNDSGEMIYTYHLGNATASCTDMAHIVLNVMRDGTAEGVVREDKLAFCMNAVPKKLNLNKEFGITMTGGSWSTEGTAPAPNGGVIDLSAVTAPVNFVYKYSYSGGSCGAAGEDVYTIVITDNLSDHFKDASREICKAANPNGHVDLMGILGVDIPNSVGIWTEGHVESPVDVADGYFELADSRAGTYEYTFTVSNSATNLCGITGESAKVTLHIFDNGEVLDAEIQVCSSREGNINLAEYMPNLPSSGSWDGGKIAVSDGSIAASDLQMGVNMFSYTFDGGACSSGTAMLYVTVTDEITSFTDKTLTYCLTDKGADAIDLDQKLGVFVSGSWSGDQTSTVNWKDGNVFDGRAAGVGEYVFTFKADADSCNINSGDSVTITIKITEDLTK